MKSLSVVKVDQYMLKFEDGTELYSDHDQDCCESHYLDLSDLSIDDFEGLEFDLSSDEFFKRIEGYGIELIPIKGYSVKIPGYASNNGYYSSNLSLIIRNSTGTERKFNIDECQEY